VGIAGYSSQAVLTLLLGVGAVLGVQQAKEDSPTALLEDALHDVMKTRGVELGQAPIDPTVDDAPLPDNGDELANATAQQKDRDAVRQAKSTKMAAIKEERKEQEELRMLMKPPGCRPRTTEEMFSYRQFRTQCATAKPAPSAFSTPATQTPIEVQLSNLRVTALNDQKSTFTLEMERKFIWSDQAAQTNDLQQIWTPKMMFSFPNSIKCEDIVPPDLQNDLNMVTLTETLRVTFHNKWDHSKFPRDGFKLYAQMWSGAGTRRLEPVTVRMDPTVLPNDLFGFTPQGDILPLVTNWGEPLGPGGVWGQSQMIELEVEVVRSLIYPLVKIFVPATLCALVAFAGFFIKISQLMPRLATAVFAFLILVVYMMVLAESANMPQRTYLVWAEYWLVCQAIIITVACIHHCMCHYLNERYGETKAMHLDIAMRVCFPVAYGLTYLWTQGIVVWGGLTAILTNALSAVFLVFLFLSIYGTLEKRTTVRYEKSHYPGI